jgi:predicted RNA-binding Zn ribbon-like protein
MEPVSEIPYPGEREAAPGRLRLVQQFVNTVDFEHGREMLSDPERLRVVLSELGLLAASAPVSKDDLGRALAVREALRSVALANNGGAVDRKALATLENAAVDGRLTIRFEARETTLDGSSPGVRGALATLVGIVHTATADGTWPRLKACQRDVCHWLFYDRSRNRSARWCQMAVCGNRTKTRAYRTRRRASPVVSEASRPSP